MTAAALRVAVIGGGANCEHAVSLASAASVATALDQLGYDVVRLTIDPDGWWLDEAGTLIGLAAAVEVLRGCDVAMPVVHGPHGEDGTLAALCDLAGVPFVGSAVGAGALAMDKWATKLVAEAIGIRTAAGTVLTRQTAAAYSFTGPVVVKPIAAGSSQGVTLVRTGDQLGPALDGALALDRRVLVEEVVLGREIDIAVLGTADGRRRVSPALEILTEGLFDYATKYDGSATFLVPAPLDAGERDHLAGAAVAMYDALGCRGVARVDFFLTEAGLLLNEVNTMPGFTPVSMFPRMWAASGVDYPTLIDRLLRTAMARRPGLR